jgi:uncharacterized membrane protein (UPF0127 family)
VGWLLRDGEVVANLEIAQGRSARRKGLLGRDGVAGGLWLEPASSVHTLGMRFPLDVAFLRPRPDDDPGPMERWEVVATCRMPPHRVSRPRMRATAVLEAEAGAFARWRVEPGVTVEVRR